MANGKTVLDFFEAAESALRGNATMQAAALIGNAADLVEFGYSGRDLRDLQRRILAGEIDSVELESRLKLWVDLYGENGDKLELLKRFEAVAKKHNIATLEERGNDSRDFFETSVWSVRELMEAAYRMGREDARK